MNKFLIATLISLTPHNAIVEPAKSIVEKPVSEQKLGPGCITKEAADNVLNTGEYEILLRGTDPLKRTTEVWFSGKKEVVMIAYEQPKDGKPESIKEVCITGYGEDIIFNGDAVELLKKALDKVNPKT